MRMRHQGRTLPCLSTSSEGEVAEVKNKATELSGNNGRPQLRQPRSRKLGAPGSEVGSGGDRLRVEHLWGSFAIKSNILSPRGRSQAPGWSHCLTKVGRYLLCLYKEEPEGTKQADAWLWGSQPAFSPEGLLRSSTTSLLCRSPSRRAAAATEPVGPARSQLSSPQESC